MQIALEASLNGILSLVERQDQIANNLANINTPAFKKGRQSKANFTIPGTQVTATPTDFSQGDLVPTGQDLDLAIQGEGFFSVLNGGIPAFTRAGNFHVDRDGNLVTPQGYPVEPAITFPPETERIEVAQDGNVFAVMDGGATTVNVGRLEPVRFQNAQGLVPLGDNLFQEGPDSGSPLNGSFGDQGFPTLRQRFLEQSNVDLAQEITDEMVTQRAFQANIRTFQTADQIIGSTLDLFR